MDVLSCGVLVASVSVIHLVIVAAARLFPIVGSRMTSMSAHSQPDVLAGKEQLLPNLSAEIARLNLVAFVIRILRSLAPKQGMCEENNCVVLIFLTVTELFSPFENLISGCPFSTYDEEFAQLFVLNSQAAFSSEAFPSRLGNAATM